MLKNWELLRETPRGSGRVWVVSSLQRTAAKFRARHKKDWEGHGRVVMSYSTELAVGANKMARKSPGRDHLGQQRTWATGGSR